MKKSSILILLLTVMILTISAVGAADTNVTSDLAHSQLADDSVALALDDSDADSVLADKNTESLAIDGDNNFTALQQEIDSGYVDLQKDYVRMGSEDSLIIDKMVVFYGNNYKIDGNGAGGIFKIVSGGTLILQDVILVNGSSENGGAIYNNGVLSVTRCTFIDNTATGNGGAIYNDGNLRKLDEAVFKNNNAEKGGALYTTKAVNLEDSNFINNSASDIGGAIYLDNVKMSVVSSSFENNTALSKAGAIYSINDLTVRETRFAGNKVTRGFDDETETGGSQGGAIYAEGSQLHIEDSEFIENTATPNDHGDGAAIYANVETVSVSGTTFRGNKGFIGGAVYLVDVDQTAPVFDNCTFDSNLALQGGAINLEASSYVYVNDTVFVDNQAYSDRYIGKYNDFGAAAAIGAADGSDITIKVTNSKFIRNSVTSGPTPNSGYGAAIISTGSLYVENSEFINNTADEDGAIVAYYNPGTVSIVNSNFTGNKATSGVAGAIETSASKTLTITGSNFFNNTAAGNGGAVVSKGETTISGSKFIDNSADGDGGALYINGGNVEISDSVFSNNRATNGGAIYAKGDATLTITACNLTNNVATGKGNAIYNDHSTLLLSNNNISKTTTDVYSTGGTISPVKIDITIDGESTYIYPVDEDIILNATITDADGNLINVDNFKFIITSGAYSEENTTVTYISNGKYTATINPANDDYNYIVDVMFDSDTAVTYITTTATLLTEKGSYSDLQRKINAAKNGDKVLNLTYDFIYTTGIDDVQTTFDFTNGIIIDDTLTINGNGYTISGNGTHGIFNVSAETTLNNITFTDAAADTGAAIWSSATLTVNDSIFEDNVALLKGGAIYSNGALTVQNSKFIGNDVTNDFDDATGTGGSQGGAIYAIGPELKVVDCDFIENTATPNDHGDGAAIYANVNTISVSGTTFRANRGFLGGAVYLVGVTQDTIAFNNCTFDSNIALQGGAISAEASSNLYVNDTVFVDNQAFSDRYDGSHADFGAGAAIGAGDGSDVTIKVTNSKFIRNTVTSGPIPNSGFGAAIMSTGSVYVENSEFINNTADEDGAIVAYHTNPGTVTIINSNFTGNKATSGIAGVIEASATKTVTITGSNFIDNSAGSNGGVIVSKGELTIENSKFINNAADGDGGAVYISSGIATISDSEFSGNTADGVANAIYLKEGVLTLNNNDINKDEAEIYVNTGAYVTKVNVTVMDNYTYAQDGSHDLWATISDVDGNLIEDAQFKFYVGDKDPVNAVYNKTSKLYEATISGLEKINYVVTVKHEIAGCEINVKNATLKTIKGTYTELQKYIDELVGDTLVLEYNFTYDEFVDADKFPYGVLVNKSINIDGQGFTINGANSYRIFNVTADATLKDIAFVGGNADIGGAIWTNATLTVVDSTFENNTAVYQGGAIYSEDSLTVENTEFLNNTVTNDFDDVTETGGSQGGAIYAIGDELNVVDSKFIENVATPDDHGDGAAIWANVNTITVSGTTFRGNKGFIGGAVYLVGVTQDTPVFNNCTFDNNTALQGGAISAEASSYLYVNDTVFVDNQAFSDRYDGSHADFGAGAAIGAADGSDVTIKVTNSKFIRNTVTSNDESGFGGAIISTGSLIVENSEFINNTASSGAAIMVYNAANQGTLSIKSSTFNGNNATDKNAGVIATSASKTVTIEDTYFVDNYAAVNGGVITVKDDLTIDNAHFINNIAGNNGGAVYINGGDAVIKNSEFSGNTANGVANAIYLNTGTLNLTNNDINKNVAEIFNNDGTIISYINATILGNTTVTRNTPKVILNATVVDDNGNLIDDINLKFVIDDKDKYDGVYNTTTNLFEVGLDLIPGTYKVDMSYEKDSENFHTFIGIYKNIQGTYTDLRNYIGNTTAGETLVLPYDFEYFADIDGDDFPNGILIDKPITIDGNGSTISGNQTHRIFVIEADDVVLKNVTLTEGIDTDSGAAVYWTGANGKAISSNFTNNYINKPSNSKSNVYGAAIYWAGNHGYVDDCNFINNTADSTRIRSGANGGAIYWAGNDGFINNSKFSENKVNGYGLSALGAAVYLAGNNIAINNSTFTDNTAQVYLPTGSEKPAGGAIYIKAAGTSTYTYAVSNSTFANNVINSTLPNNVIRENPNAIYMENKFALLYLENNTINTEYAEIVNSEGVFGSNVIVTILENQTVFLDYKENVIINATVSDDNGNLIYDAHFKYTFTGGIPSVTADASYTVYQNTETVNLPDSGYYLVNVTDTSNKFQNLTVKTALLAYVIGTFTDLQDKINSADGELNLTYDFKFTPSIDELEYVNFDNGMLINKTIIINGNGHKIDADDLRRIFKITENATLNNITFVNGFTNDFGGAIWTNATVFINNSTFYDNDAIEGGAIFVSDEGNVTVNDTIFDFNSAEYGGAIASTGSLTVKDSKFVLNEAFESGNAIYAFNNGILSLQNNEINTTAADIVLNGAKVISYLNVTILENRTIDVNAVKVNLTAFITDDNGNLINATGFKFNVTGNKTESIEAIYNATSKLYEAELTIPDESGIYYVNMTYYEPNEMDIYTGIYRNIKGTYTELQNLINNTNVRETLELPYDFAYTDFIDGSEFPYGVLVNKSIVIDGKGFTISGSDSYRIFNVTADAAFKEITFTRGNADIGGAIWSNATLIFVGSTFENNTAVYQGGAIYSDGNLTVVNTEFLNNTVTNDFDDVTETGGSQGGAIYAIGIELNVVDSKFIENVATPDDHGDGAAIWANVNTITVSGTTFRGNKGFLGGAVYLVGVTQDTPVFNNCTFDNNTALQGGAVFVEASSYLHVNDTIFVDNKAVSDRFVGQYNDFAAGGAISAADGSPITVLVNNSRFVHNTVTSNDESGFGGAIISAGSLIIDNTLFDSNEAGKYAAVAVYYGANPGVLNITGSIFTANNANETKGAAVYVSAGKTLYINDTEFTDNTANEVGGAVYINGADATVENSRFSGNKANNTANAIYLNAGNLKLQNNTINKDVAEIFNNAGTITSYMNATILGNQTVTRNTPKVILNATVIDDKGNLIDDANFKFLINGKDKYDAVYNTTSNLYEVELDLLPGIYKVNMTYEKESENIETFIGIYINTRGSYTDLNNQIANTPDGETLVLPYNFIYSTEIDGDAFIDGILINKPITIDGNGSSISGNDSRRIFNVTSNNVVLNNITFVDGNADLGGAIYSNVVLKVANSTFVNNTAAAKGAAIYSNGTLTVENTEFINNTVTNDYAHGGSQGGAIYAIGDELNVADSKFIENVATPNDHGDGAAIYAKVTTINVTGTTFRGNKAFLGGAVYLVGVTQDTIAFNNCTFDSNIALQGGAISAEASSNLYVNDTVFVDNQAFSDRFIGTNPDFGAAAAIGAADGSDVTIKVTNSKFIRNTVTSGPIPNSGYGAAIISTGSVYVENSEFINNTADEDGVIVVYHTNPGTVTIINSNFTGNKATGGIAGVIETSATKNLIITGSNFINNSAAGNGGVLYIKGTAQISDSTFINNVASGNGTVIFITKDAELTLTKSNFTDNGAVSAYAIYNLGTISLNGNNVSNIIYNNGTILTNVIAKLLDNTTYTADLADQVVLNATLTDFEGNAIYDPDFRFSVDGEEINEISYDAESKLYLADYIIQHAGQTIVNTSYVSNDLTILKGIFKTGKANVTAFNITATNAKAGGNVTVNVTLLGVDNVGLNETFEIVVGDQIINVTTVNGTAVFNVTGLASGHYTAFSAFDNDDYNRAYAYDLFTVYEPEVQISIDVESIAYGDVAVINITLKTADGKDFNGTVFINVTGAEPATIAVVNGKGSVQYADLPINKYTVNATYLGTELYEPVYTTAEFYVTQGEATITATSEPVDFGTNSTIVVIVPENATGKVFVIIDGIEYGTVFDNTTSTVIIDCPVLNAGTHNFVVNYTGDASYNATSCNVVVTVNKVDSQMNATLVSGDIKFGDNATINIESLDDIDGNLTVTVDGDLIATFTTIPASVNITGLTPGAHTITLNYVNATNYEDKEFKFTVNVAKIDPAMVIDAADEIHVGDNLTVKIVLPENATGTVMLIVGNQVITYTNVSGSFEDNITGLNVGAQAIVAIYSGDENYTNETKTSSVNVVEVETIVKPTFNVGAVGENTTITVELNPTATGYVMVDVQGNTMAAEIKDGKVQFNITPLETGLYNVTIVYAGDSNFPGKTVETNFTVTGKGETTIKVVTESSEVNITDDVIIEFSISPEFAKGNVTLYIDGAVYNNTYFNSSTGSFTIRAGDLTLGTHTVSAKFLGNDNYEASDIASIELNVNNKLLDPEFGIVESSLNGTYGEDLIVNITIADAATGNITIYAVTVNDDGSMVYEYVGNLTVVDARNGIPLSGIEAGSQMLRFVYSGDDNYSDDYVDAIAKIDKADPVINIIVDDVDNLSAFAITNVTISIPKATGRILIDNNGIVKLANLDENGTYKFEIFDLQGGEYYINVTYLGDKNNNEADNITSFNVNKVSANVNITNVPAQPVKSTDDVVFNIVVDNNFATGNVTVYVDGVVVPGLEAAAIDDYGSVNVTISGFTNGTHTIKVVYNGDNNFNASESQEYTITAVKEETLIDIDGPSIVLYGTDLYIEFEIAPQGANGNVTLFIDGVEFETAAFAGNSGIFVIPAANLTLGNHTIGVKYLGNDLYDESNTDSYIVNVSDIAPGEKIDPKITIDIANETSIFAIGATNVTITVQNGFATGKIKIEGREGEFELVNGTYVLELYDLTAGEHNILVTYLGDERYNEANATIKFTVQKGTATPVISNLTAPVNVGENVTFIVTMDNDAANGTVTIYVDGIISQVIVLDDDYANASITLSGLSAGNHTIGVRYDGNDNFGMSDTITEMFVVNKLDSTISIVVGDVGGLGPMGATNVTISIPGATGKIILDNNGIVKLVELDENGTYTFDIYDLQAGEYDINVTYLGDDKYNGANNATTFNIPKAGSQVEIDVPTTVDTTQPVNVAVTVIPDFATGTVTVYIDGVENMTVTLGDTGAANISIPALGSGNHTIKVVYNGDLNYNASESDVKSINVTKADVGDKISVEGSSVVPGEIATVSVEGLPKDATGTVTVTIGNNTYNATVENGNAVVEIPGLTEGVYEFPVVYSGDDKYAGVTAPATIIIKSTPEANITVPSDIKAGDDANVTVSIPNATGNVSVIVDGVETIVPLDENGTAVVPINNVTPGAHSVVVVYPGNEFVAPIIASDAFNVADKSPTEIVDVVIGKDYIVTARLVDADGVGVANAVINYTINGVAGSTITEEDGIFTIEGQNNCIINIDYAGASAYMPTNTSVTISFTRLSTYIVGDTFTQYAIDYYAGERGGYFEVQLFDENGKALANKSVKIGFNGVVYNSITNATGWAKLQINLRSAGKYTFAVGFLGDDDYTGSMEVYLIQVNKKPTSISASSASYSASAKTKKYTVTLNTQKCSSIDGKTYLDSGKVMKLTIGDKTYTAKTDSKGKATFNISLTKKGTYSATVKFAGDSAYAASSKTVKITLK